MCRLGVVGRALKVLWARYLCKFASGSLFDKISRAGCHSSLLKRIETFSWPLHHSVASQRRDRRLMIRARRGSRSVRQRLRTSWKYRKQFSFDEKLSWKDLYRSKMIGQQCFFRLFDYQRNWETRSPLATQGPWSWHDCLAASLCTHQDSVCTFWDRPCHDLWLRRSRETS